MVFVRFILKPLAKKSYQLVLYLAHEAILFTCLPYNDAITYSLLTTGVYGVYFGLMLFFLALRYHDLHPKNKDSAYYALDNILILK